jgi:nucleoside transporter
MPTLSLTNAIGFAHLEDPGRDFPAVRVWGTLGWIVAGLTVSFVLAGMLKIDVPETTCYPLRLGAIASLVMGLFALSLPPTPPQAAGQKVTVRAILGLDTLSLLRDRSFALFAISSLLICIPLSFYYAFAGKFLADSGMTNIAGKMTLGQVSEIFFMLVMPFFFKRLGVKRMLLAGMLCWVLRYLLFATGNSSSLVGLLYLGILLHGICYDFFFVTGQIYIEQRAPESLRASAQGFITFITLGLGMVIGTQLSGWIAGTYTRVNETGQTVNRWPAIWLIPALMALIVAIVFAFGFKPPKNKDGR